MAQDAGMRQAAFAVALPDEPESGKAPITNEAVGAYKSLSQVERAFRSLKSVDLKVRPIHHRLAQRVKLRVFLCMLAYYLEWHMGKAWLPILFDDPDPADAARHRPNMVLPAKRSIAAKRKAASKKTDAGLPVHSFQTLPQSPETPSRRSGAERRL